MEILNSIWYHCGTDTIGIVKSKNDKGEINYYCGTGSGEDKEQDELRIRDWGTKFNPVAGEILMP